MSAKQKKVESFGKNITRETFKKCVNLSLKIIHTEISHDDNQKTSFKSHHSFFCRRSVCSWNWIFWCKLQFNLFQFRGSKWFWRSVKKNKFDENGKRNENKEHIFFASVEYCVLKATNGLSILSDLKKIDHYVDVVIFCVQSENEQEWVNIKWIRNKQTKL